MGPSEQKILRGSVIFFILYLIGVNSFDTSGIKNAHIGQFYYYYYFFSLSIILFIFSVLVGFKSWINEYSSLFFLIISVFSASVAYFFGFLNWDPAGGRYYETDFFQLQVLFTTISTLAIYRHYLNRRSTPSTGLIALVIFLFTPHSLLNIYYIITNNYSPDLAGIHFQTLILLQIGSIFVFGWITYNGRTVSKSLLMNESSRVRRLGASQLLGFYLLFLSVIGELIESVFPIEVLNKPLFGIALLLIGVPYYLDPKVFLLVQINIKAMGIITKDGLTMYFKPIAEEFKDEEDLSSQLFGGLVIALSTMGQEVLKTKQRVDSLNFGDRSIIVECNNPFLIAEEFKDEEDLSSQLFGELIIALSTMGQEVEMKKQNVDSLYFRNRAIIVEYNDPFYFVIFANTATYFLEREMNEYLKDLKADYSEDPGGEIISEEVFDELNKKFFPILGEDIRSF